MSTSKGEAPFQRRPTNTKVYGKKAARRTSLVTPASQPADLSDDSDDSDEDDLVVTTLLSHDRALPNGKGKAKEDLPVAPSPRRAETAPGALSRRGVGAGGKAPGGSVVKTMAARRTTAVEVGSSSRAAGSPRGGGDNVEWDEGAALAALSRPNSGGEASGSARRPVLKASKISSPSPRKRARPAAASTSAKPSPPPPPPPLGTTLAKPSPSKSKRSSPFPSRIRDSSATDVVIPSPSPARDGAHSTLNASAEAEVVEPGSPPRRKRARTRPDSALFAPAPRLALTPVPPTSSESTSVPLPKPQPTSPSSPRRQQRPTTPEVFTAPTPPAAPSPSPIKSPAKDLSKVFEMFVTGDQGEGKKAIGGGQALVRSGSGVIASMAGRSPERLKSPDPFSRSPSNSQTLERAHSYPSFPPSSPQSHSQPLGNNPFFHSSSRALGPSTSLPSTTGSRSPARPTTPVKAPSRPLSRTNTLTAVDSGALAPRGVAGAKKTYGGARSFKRDVEEDRLFASGPIGATPAKNATTTTKSSPSTTTSSARKLLLPALPRPPPERRSYSAMRTVLGVDDEEELEESQGPSALKSITQLRARGENSRFVDEFRYLVDGLGKGQSLGVRRASAIEVLRKLMEKDFLRRLKASGFVEDVYKDFRKAEAGQGDRALDPALAFLVGILARDQRITEPLLRLSTADFSTNGEHDAEAIFDEPTCDVLVVLGEMLGRSWAGEEIGAKDVKGLSKADARTLSTIREIIDKAWLVEDGSLPINLRSLTLVAISGIASFAPRSIFRPQHLVCTSGTLDAVVATFVFETKGLELRMARYESGLDLLPSDGSINLHFIDLCLRIFEATTSATPLASSILSTHSTTLAPSLSHLILACHILAVEPAPSTSAIPGGGSRAAAMDCLLSALRMLIDLTTNDPSWSVAVASVPGVLGTLVKLIAATRVKDARAMGRFTSLSSPAVQAAAVDVEMDTGDGDAARGEGKKEAGENVKFDVLCLALGVLTNLVETVEGIKDVLRETLIDPMCKEQRKCARQCHCSGRTTAIHQLTALYLDPLEDSSNELNTSFVNGYSGILLGLVMLDVPANQDIVTEALAGHRDAKDKLVEAMEEFATLHEQSESAVDGDVEMEHEDGEVEGEVKRGASDVAERIRKMLGRIQGSG